MPDNGQNVKKKDIDTLSEWVKTGVVDVN